MADGAKNNHNPEASKKVKHGKAWACKPGDWEAEKHYYPRALNAQLHPLVASFLKLSKLRIATRYCHLHPETNKEKLLEVLSYKPRDFRWAGADLFCVTNELAQQQMIVIETNSCPSGQKSMPLIGADNDSVQDTQYFTMIKETFGPILKRTDLPKGALAVIFDKNPMEATGYAQALADFTGKTVLLAEMFRTDPDMPARWNKEAILEVRVDRALAEEALFEGEDVELLDAGEAYPGKVWVPIKSAFRYVTTAPWTRLPVVTKTAVVNPIVSCLAGGRSKGIAAVAYKTLNSELGPSYGLTVRTPETITDVGLSEIPLYVKSMGYFAVIKNPYSNAGQGVFTIASKAELDDFMALDHPYDRFLVQALVGNSSWSSISNTGGSGVGGHGSLKYYHVGTVPDVRNNTYVADVRMMVCASEDGMRPLAIYARRAHTPLAEELKEGANSWAMLGTNLSVLKDDGSFDSDTSRLMLMDRRDFNKLGISIDSLVDGFIQTVLATMAIDRMCKRLLTSEGVFHAELFNSINRDESLISEIMPSPIDSHREREEADALAEEDPAKAPAAP